MEIKGPSKLFIVMQALLIYFGLYSLYFIEEYAFPVIPENVHEPLSKYLIFIFNPAEILVDSLNNLTGYLFIAVIIAGPIILIRRGYLKTLNIILILIFFIFIYVLIDFMSFYEQSRIPDNLSRSAIKKFSLAANGFISSYGYVPDAEEFIASVDNISPLSDKCSDYECLLDRQGVRLPVTCDGTMWSGVGDGQCYFKYFGKPNAGTYEIWAKTSINEQAMLRYTNINDNIEICRSSEPHNCDLELFVDERTGKARICEKKNTKNCLK